mgnify:CR=1 FL=1
MIIRSPTGGDKSFFTFLCVHVHLCITKLAPPLCQPRALRGDDRLPHFLSMDPRFRGWGQDWIPAYTGNDRKKSFVIQSVHNKIRQSSDFIVSISFFVLLFPKCRFQILAGFCHGRFKILPDFFYCLFARIGCGFYGFACFFNRLGIYFKFLARSFEISL